MTPTSPLVALGLSLLFLTASSALARESANASPAAESSMPKTIHGEFDVTMIPQANTEQEGAAPGRFVLDKRYHGPLEATARGQMLAHRTEVSGSAVYVAMELVDGRLEGREGTFVLHHRGVMNRGAQSLSIEVVPDSGTGELVGLSGSMTIEVKDGKHFYGFEYQLRSDSAEP